MSTIWNYLAAPNPASGAIPFVGLDNVTINVDVLNFYWNKTAAQLSVSTNGDYTGTDSINAYAQHDQYLPQSLIGAAPTTASGTSPGFTTSTSRGTGQIPQISINADFAGHFSSWAYTGTVSGPGNFYTPITSIYSLVKGSGFSVGGELHIATKGDNGNLIDRLVFDNAGTATLTGNLTVSGTISSAALLTGAFSGSFNATLGTVVANGMYLPLGNTLAFSTNSTRQLTIDQSGRVLVNLAADAGGGQAFQVNGAGIVSGVFSAGNINLGLSIIPANGFYLANTNTIGGSINGNNLININANGLGIGAVPTSVQALTVLNSALNSALFADFSNLNAGNAANVQLRVVSNAGNLVFASYSSAFVSAGAQKASGGALLSVGLTSLNIGSFSNAPVFIFVNNAQVAQYTATAFTLSAGCTLTLNGGTLLATTAALTNGAAAAAGTLLNAPAAGNPTKWIPISDNGTTRFIPAW